jgi:hypothetical protein
MVVGKSTNVSVDHIASILRAEEKARQETSMKQTASKPVLPPCIALTSFNGLPGPISQKTELVN